MSYDASNFGVVTGSSALATVVLLTITAIIGFRIGRHNVVDVTWGLGFVLIALVCALVGEGSAWRRWLLFVLVAIWGLRLALSMARRSAGKGEDPRYEKMLYDAGGNRTLVAIRKIYLTQGLALWFVSLPIQVSAAAGGTLNWLACVGIAVWVLGVVFESVGDKQMDEFKSDPANKGTVMDRGLWGWTRHPNYFGDSCVWWGIYLIVAGYWPGALTIASPIVMTYFLVFATGARLLEQHMEQRPGYAEYQQRVSYFLPRPPKKQNSTS